MKFFFFLALAALSLTASGQGLQPDFSSGEFKASAGYVHEFSGMNGIGASLSYQLPLNEWFQLEAGIRRVEANGHPRTDMVQEFTRATALEGSALFSPIHTESQSLRIGLGYSFADYDIRRATPVVGASKEIQYQTADASGLSRGIIVHAEYEWNINERFSAGARVGYYKAYTYVVMAGPFIGIHL